MKDFVKFGLAGVVGYLVGVCEFKYKTMKLITKAMLEKEEKKEEEAQ